MEETVYTPPVLVEVGEFTEVTAGTVGQVSDEGAYRDN
ncbi:lasso RiPP family leader peptide-containing protein [Longimycelium tulufanense]|nr:lasso RiPP family leader peptide-containing protein [Longimycelium tulufanense]